MEDMHHASTTISLDHPALGGASPRKKLEAANPELAAALLTASTLEGAREALYLLLERTERATFALDCDLHPLEVALIRQSIRNFRAILAPNNERRVNASALDRLWKLMHNESVDVSAGFVLEFVALFRGLAGRSGLYRDDRPVRHDERPDFARQSGRAAALLRTRALDTLGQELIDRSCRYPSGLEESVIERRRRNQSRILKHFGASLDEWRDYRWHLDNVIIDSEVLLQLVEVSPELAVALRQATRSHLPVGMTPYYVSLMDFTSDSAYDHAVRAQVIPPPEYVEALTAHRSDREQAFDFMGERDTSPVDLITRRYPFIAILKPYNTCAQICVYCQRNWEIDECMAPDAMAPDDQIEAAIAWLAAHPQISEVLVTGGDPAVMDDERLGAILERLSTIDHIRRIRLGTRTLVVLPFRWTESLVETLARFHEPGRREVAVVTHFEHSYEITPEALEAVQRIRRRGISVYNQTVFTVFNSRRFETVKLRRDLRAIGVDPYYTFNMKGKRETARYMLPIARILQELKEEARLLPGLDRTDEPVFNVPRLGKHHLRAVDDRQLIMIKPNGARVYEFLPWEKNIAAVPTYIYEDVPVLDYLDKLAGFGEDISDYSSIWYYY